MVLACISIFFLHHPTTAVQQILRRLCKLPIGRAQKSTPKHAFDTIGSPTNIHMRLSYEWITLWTQATVGGGTPFFTAGAELVARVTSVPLRQSPSFWSSVVSHRIGDSHPV